MSGCPQRLSAPVAKWPCGEWPFHHALPGHWLHLGTLGIRRRRINSGHAQNVQQQYSNVTIVPSSSVCYAVGQRLAMTKL